MPAIAFLGRWVLIAATLTLGSACAGRSNRPLSPFSEARTRVYVDDLHTDLLEVGTLARILTLAIGLSDGLTIGGPEDAQFVVKIPGVKFPGNRLAFEMELYAFKSTSNRESTLIYRTDLRCGYRAMFDCGLSALKLIERAIERATGPVGRPTARSSSLVMTR